MKASYLILILCILVPFSQSLKLIVPEESEYSSITFYHFVQNYGSRNDFNGTLYLPDDIFMCNKTYSGLSKEDNLVFVILRGNCTFTEKIKNAVNSNASAVVIANTEKDVLFMELAQDFKDIRIVTTQFDTFKILKILKYNQSECRIIIDKDGSYGTFEMPLLFQIMYVIGLVLLCLLLSYYCGAAVWRYGRRYYYRHQVVAQPILRYHTESRELNQDTCAICLEQFQENCGVKKLPCHHIFHPDCVDPWLIRSVGECPVCKRNVLTTNPRTTNNNNSSSNNSRYNRHEINERNSYSQNTNLLDDSSNV